MRSINLDRQPKHLTKKFFEDYSQCKEILQKPQRQYCIALLEIDNILFAIPFRTHIRHKYCYIFKTSLRSECSGLDFTKAVIIRKSEYIGDNTFIDSREYSEFINKRSFIAKKFESFIKQYKKWALNPFKYHAENIISFSALQYFHKDLGL